MIILGLIAGIISAIIGIGGGIIIVPSLIYLGFSPTNAVVHSIAVMFVIPISALYHYYQKRLIDYHFGTLMACGAVIGAKIGVIINTVLLASNAQKITITTIFITLLCNVIYHQLFSKKYKTIPAILPYQKQFVGAKHSISIITPLLLGVLTGNIMSIAGIGGGIILIPILSRLGFHVRYLTGTIHIMILFSAISSLTSYNIKGYCFTEYSMAYLAIGAVLGAFIGSEIASRISENMHKGLFSVVAITAIIAMLNTPPLLEYDDMFLCKNSSLLHMYGKMLLLLITTVLASCLLRWIKIKYIAKTA